MSSIILYHSSIYQFNTVDLKHCKDLKDFGKGFYLTTNINQALDLIVTKKRRTGISNMFLYSFKLDIKQINSLNGHKFVGVNLSWLDFILYNRTNNERFNNFNSYYDWVYGCVADAHTQKEVDIFISDMDFSDKAKKVFIDKLNVNLNYNQYCFRSQKSIDLLNNYGNMQRKVI